MFRSFSTKSAATERQFCRCKADFVDARRFSRFCSHKCDVDTDCVFAVTKVNFAATNVCSYNFRIVVVAASGSERGGFAERGQNS